VEPVLNPPRRKFVLELEIETRPAVTNEIVNGAKPVKCATEFAAQEWMDLSSMNCCCRDLEHPLDLNGLDELVRIGIRLEAIGEHDLDRLFVPPTHEIAEDAIGLALELFVSGDNLTIAGHARSAQIPRTHFGSDSLIDPNHVVSSPQNNIRTAFQASHPARARSTNTPPNSEAHVQRRTSEPARI
jgi:hypothetical protein